jgi:phospholipase/carboxylesterase
MSDRSTNLHAGQPLLAAGAALNTARAAMIMIHGRGATAESILSLAAEFNAPGMALLAPQAAGNTWYPHSFLMPIEQNEPYLSSALATIGAVLAQVGAAGIAPERTLLLGFSQGACLALEFAARNARRYGGVVGLSGGLIGPDGTPRDYAGSLDGSPVFLGCSDVDFHIPKARVEYSAEVLGRLGGDVTMRLYPGMGHTVNRDEIAAVQRIIDGVLRPS